MHSLYDMHHLDHYSDHGSRFSTSREVDSEIIMVFVRLVVTLLFITLLVMGVIALYRYLTKSENAQAVDSSSGSWWDSMFSSSPQTTTTSPETSWWWRRMWNTMAPTMSPMNTPATTTTTRPPTTTTTRPPVRPTTNDPFPYYGYGQLPYPQGKTEEPLVNKYLPADKRLYYFGSNAPKPWDTLPPASGGRSNAWMFTESPWVRPWATTTPPPFQQWPYYNNQPPRSTTPQAPFDTTRAAHGGFAGAGTK